MHWGYWVPAGIGLLVGMHLAADVSVSRSENCSTTKLRLLFLVAGLSFLYVGGLALYFDLSLSRFGTQGSKPHQIIFLIIGIILLFVSAFRSRDGLIKDSDYITKSADEIDLSGVPEIPPADRVK